MEIPIIIEGRESGRLTVEKDGPYTLFSGRCAETGTLLRLAVYGGGREGYLGVMEPRDGELTLRRRLSRAAMRGFPEPMEYAGEAGAPAQSRAETSAAGTGTEESPAPPAARPQEKGTETEIGDIEAAAEDAERASGPAPPAEPERAAGILWYSAGDGSLYTVWEGRGYRAVPWAAHGLPESRMVERRRIEGVDYAVFALEDGSFL